MTQYLDLKTFIPAKNFTISKKFYLSLGFFINWETDNLIEFQVGEFRFLLQNFYVKELAENYMIHLQVENLDQWIQEIRISSNKRIDKSVSISKPKEEPWGMYVSYLKDPSGILWHIAQPMA